MAGEHDVLYRVGVGVDFPQVATLHAESWRRHYRGAYSDAYLDGDVVADRLEVWGERMAHLERIESRSWLRRMRAPRRFCPYDSRRRSGLGRTDRQSACDR